MKKKQLSALLLIVGLSVFAGTAEAGVIAGSQRTYNGHDYAVLEASTWQNLQNEAASLNADLATINDAAENAWVTSTFVTAYGTSTQYGPFIYIGLNDIATEGTFVWASGEPVTYTNWAGGEPNDQGGEDVVHLGRFTDRGLWNDIDGDGWRLTGVIEYRTPAVPLPPAAFLGLGLLGGVGLISRMRKRRATA